MSLLDVRHLGAKQKESIKEYTVTFKKFPERMELKENVNFP